MLTITSPKSISRNRGEEADLSEVLFYFNFVPWIYICVHAVVFLAHGKNDERILHSADVAFVLLLSYLPPSLPSPSPILRRRETERK